MTLEKMREKYPEEFRAFLEDGDDLPDHLYKELYYMMVEDMPYGTATAEVDDPYQWIGEKIFEAFAEKPASK